MKNKRMEKAYKRFRYMCVMNPDLMAAVMTWNNMDLECDLPENSLLQKKYIELVKEAKKITEGTFFDFFDALRST